MEHGCSQRGSKQSCSYVTAESRIGDIRRRRYRFVICFCDEWLRRVVLCEGGRGRDAFGLKGARFELPLPIADALCRKWLEQRC